MSGYVSLYYSDATPVYCYLIQWERSARKWAKAFKKSNVQPILLVPSVLLSSSVRIHQLSITGPIFKKLHLIYFFRKFSFQPEKKKIMCLYLNTQIPHIFLETDYWSTFKIMNCEGELTFLAIILILKVRVQNLS